jgi:hypothetical protein
MRSVRSSGDWHETIATSSDHMSQRGATTRTSQHSKLSAARRQAPTFAACLGETSTTDTDDRRCIPWDASYSLAEARQAAREVLGAGPGHVQRAACIVLLRSCAFIASLTPSGYLDIDALAV